MQHAKSPQVGDIYLVRFHPGYGAELKKFRFAVVVNAGIDERFVLLAPFTTNIQTNRSSIELVIKNSALTAPSLLLTWYLLTVDSTRLMRKLGTLSKSDMTSVRRALRSIVL